MVGDQRLKGSRGSGGSEVKGGLEVVGCQG